MGSVAVYVVCLVVAAGFGSLVMSAAMAARSLHAMARRVGEPIEVRVIIVDAETMISEVEEHLRGES